MSSVETSSTFLRPRSRGKQTILEENKAMMNRFNTRFIAEDFPNHGARAMSWLGCFLQATGADEKPTSSKAVMRFGVA